MITYSFFPHQRTVGTKGKKNDLQIMSIAMEQPPIHKPKTKIKVIIKAKPVEPPKPVVPAIKLKAKLKQKKDKPPDPHIPEHEALVKVCRCGYIPPHNLVNKKIPTLDEYNTWIHIKDMLGNNAAKYFSLPVDKPHTCNYGHIISFCPSGYELCSKETQKSIMKQKEPLVALITIIKHVARGLDILNSIGIIHLDIKPSNIIVDINTFESKIIDIGNAQYMHKPFVTATTIDPNTKAITAPTYPYYPPHKFYFETWLDSLSATNIFSMCNAVTDIQTAHRKLVKDHYLNDNECRKLIAVYQRDDPRDNIYRILEDPELLGDLRRLELRSWDIYGLGMTVWTVLHFYEGLNKDHILYCKLLDFARQMTYPDASMRPSFGDFLKK